MLFDTFVTTVWKPSCSKLRECTKVGYESALNCHILPQWSGRDMDSISMADIESWLDSFDKPGAARKAYAVFRSILRRVQTRFDRQRRDQTRDTPATTTALRAASTVRVGSTRTVERLLRASARSMAIGVRVRRIAPVRKRGRRMGRLGLATRHRHGEKVGAMGGRP